MWLLIACVEEAPVAPAAADTAGVDTAGVDTGEPVEFDAEVDVIVVGTGPAGTAAAVTAAEEGATVVVFERDDEPGWGMRLGGLALGVATRWQAAAGVDDSVEAAIAEWPDITGSVATDGVIDFLAHSAETLEWIEARGPAIEGPLAEIDAGSVPRIHSLGHEDDPYPTFTAHVTLDTRVGVEVTAPVVVDGEVVGVYWRDVVTGSEGATGARSVVIATGGFVRNRERVNQVRPDLADRDVVYESNLGSDGGGLPFLDVVGAGTLRPEDIGIYVHAIEDPLGAPGEALVALLPPGSIVVGATGDRFVDEDVAKSFDFFDLMPPGDVFAVTAGAHVTRLAFMRPAYNWAEPTEVEILELITVEEAGSDAVFQADDPRSLAALVGADADRLVDAIEGFNTAAYTGTPDAFGRLADPADALEAPPYVAIRLTPGLAKTFGGVATDTEAHVLTPGGAVIPGLYAAGEVTGMVLGGGGGDGFSGSVNACYWSGRVAGSEAAARARGE